MVSYPNNWSHWSDREDQQLADAWPLHGEVLARFAEHLGRSPDSIKKHALGLGLTRTPVEQDASFKRAMIAAIRSGHEIAPLGAVKTPCTKHPVFIPRGGEPVCSLHGSQAID